MLAQRKADMAVRRPKTAKLIAFPQLHDYVQQRLLGHINRPDGNITGRSRSPRFTDRKQPTARIGVGHYRGVQGKSPNGSKLVSPQTGPCVTATRRSTNRSMSTAVVHSNGN